MEIKFRKLTQLFPKDTEWVDGCAEIIGYSPSQNLHIVIDDGQCKSEDGQYLVHKYKPKDVIVYFKGNRGGRWYYRAVHKCCLCGAEK